MTLYRPPQVVLSASFGVFLKKPVLQSSHFPGTLHIQLSAHTGTEKENRVLI